MALTTQNVKLKIDSTVYCIKDFPDIDPHGEPDQVEITDLCSEFHEYIDGLKNYGDKLEFTANYDEDKFNTLNSIGTTLKAVSIMLCVADDTSTTPPTVDTVGKNGHFDITSAEISVRLAGAGVGDVLEMVIGVKPKSAITFTKEA